MEREMRHMPTYLLTDEDAGGDSDAANGDSDAAGDGERDAHRNPVFVAALGYR